MSEQQIAAPSSSSSSGWVITAGVIEIILGSLVALLVPCSLLSLGSAVSQGVTTSTSIGSVFSGVLIYAAIAAVLIAGGIGTVRFRRWAWAVMLILSAAWLIIGLLVLVAFIAMMPAMSGLMSGEIPAETKGVMDVVLTLMGSCLGLLFVLVPGLLVGIYSRPAVRQLFNERDPKPTWTDACPLPVLALVFYYGVSALGWLSILMQGQTTLFGQVIRGLPLLPIGLAGAAILVWITLGLYRLKIAAWWTALAWNVFMLVNGVLTGLAMMTNPSLMPEISGIPRSQMDQMIPFLRNMGLTIMVISVILLLIPFGLHLYSLRFFRKQPVEQGGQAEPPKIELPQG